MINGVRALSTLLRVKRLKEENAERDAKAKREAEARAQDEAQRAKAMVQESKAGLSARKDAIWAPVMGSVCTTDEIKQTQDKETLEDKKHLKLEDEQTRRVHVQQEATESRQAADLHLRTSRIAVKKYEVLTELKQAEEDAVQEHREEVEIEDSFSTKRKGLL